MDRQLRHERPREPHEADILHDECIHACAIQQPQIVGSGFEFAGENERIESDISLHPVPVAKRDDLRQFLLREIIRPQPRIKSRQPEVNRVRPIRHRRAHAIPAAGGSEEFGCRCFGSHGERAR